MRDLNALLNPVKPISAIMSFSKPFTNEEDAPTTRSNDTATCSFSRKAA